MRVGNGVVKHPREWRRCNVNCIGISYSADLGFSSKYKSENEKERGKRNFSPSFLILNLLDFLDKGFMTTLIDHELVGTKKKEEDSN